MPHLPRLVATILLLGLTSASQGASIAPADLNRLIDSARRDGAVPVLIHLAPVTLARLGEDRAALDAELTAKRTALTAELGNNALQNGRWQSELGMIGLHLNEAGLRALAASPNAVSFLPDTAERHYTPYDSGDGRYAAIERRLALDQQVDIEVTWQVVGLPYDLDAQGLPRFQGNPRQQDEARSKASAVLAELKQPGRAGRGDLLGQSADSFQTQIRVDREAWLKLITHRDVRRIVPVGFTDSRPLRIDPAVLVEADKKGVAPVIITLKEPMLAAGLSVAAEAERVAANQRAIDSVLALAGQPDKVQAMPVFGIVVAQLTAPALRRLQASGDRRVLAVELNGPFAKPASSVSVPSTNVQSVWNLGHKGAGQYIAIIDTGVDDTHPMFTNAAGASRVVGGACFNTTDNFNLSNCPNADVFGDSLPGTPNAGRPKAGCTSANQQNCAHGTHVAGIAAGKGWSGLLGVAPDAWIVPIQAASYPQGTFYLNDVLAAFQRVLSLSAPNIINPITVNMSLGGSPLSQGPCGYASTNGSPSMEATVNTLHARGVPVIAAVGNDNFPSSINTPACIPKVIKVSGLVNNGLLNIRYSNANRPVLANFPGEYFFMAPAGDNAFPPPANATSSAAPGSSVLRLGQTSQAAPHVSGVYAVVKSGVPSATVPLIGDWLRDGARRPNGTFWEVDGIRVLRARSF